jgi:hypothetical protein
LRATHDVVIVEEAEVPKFNTQREGRNMGVQERGDRLTSHANVLAKIGEIPRLAQI